jgi:hypothetical protein
MLTKENIISSINEIEEPIILDDVLERIILLDKIQTGLQQSKDNEIISDEEMNSRIQTWLV